jgi:mannose-6-phosphate isomerase-like protein (cupin superfamily)
MMKTTLLANLPEQPASHEPAVDPGALKKILLTAADLPDGRIRMINWARIPPKKAFAAHYHEDLTEVFIIIQGRARITINQETAILKRGDAVIVPQHAVHTMRNLTGKDLIYLALGVSKKGQGKTVVVSQ